MLSSHDELMGVCDTELPFSLGKFKRLYLHHLWPPIPIPDNLA